MATGAATGPCWSVDLPGTQVLGAAAGAASLLVSTFDGVAPGTDACLAALDLRTGAIRWKLMAQRRITSALAIANRLAISVDRDAVVSARSIETGKLQWQNPLRARVPETPTWGIAPAKGQIYIGGGPVGLVALDTTNGMITWASEGPFLEFQHPVLAAERGRLVALDTQQIVSIELHNHRLSSWVWGAGTEFALAERPVIRAVCQNLLYASIGLTLLAIDLSGVICWAHTFDGAVIGCAPALSGVVVLVERQLDTAGDVLASPTAVGSRLQPVLLGLDHSGVARWERGLDGHCELAGYGSSAVLVESGSLVVVDPVDGAERRRIDAPELEGFLLVLPDERWVLSAGRVGTRLAMWDLGGLVDD